MGEELVKVPVEVVQLPVIQDRLNAVLPEIREKCELAASLVATEDNYKELKKTRADLNKERAEFRAAVKQVKDVVMAPLNEFLNGICKEVDGAYEDGVSQLDGNIKDVEGALKNQRRDEIVSYFDEYRQSLGLDSGIVSFERSGIRVGLSGTMKSLKVQVREFLDRVDGDLKMIDSIEDRDEVLAEYRISLNVTDAVRIVMDRHRRIEEERARREADEARQKVSETVAAVEAAVTSTEIGVDKEDEEEEQTYSAKYLGYEIMGTIEQLRGMKQAMVDAMLEYCEKEGLYYGKC